MAGWIPPGGDRQRARLTQCSMQECSAGTKIGRFSVKEIKENKKEEGRGKEKSKLWLMRVAHR